MTLSVELILGLVLFIFILWYLYQANKNKHFYENIPGPPTVPFFGNALDLTTTTELLNTFSRYAREYGGVVKLQIGPWRKAILVTDHKFLEFVLSSTSLLKKSEDYKFVGPWLGTGLLTGDGPKWKKHRRILTPAFHFQILEKFIDVFEQCGRKLVEKFEDELKKSQNSVEIHHLVTLCTLDIICESTMGVKINAQDNGNADYVSSVKNMCRIVIERSMSVIQMNNFLYHFTKNYFIQRKAVQILHAQANKVIIQKTKALESNQKNITDAGSRESRSRKTFLDLLLEARVDGQPLTQEEIREEVDTFMFAGHDTTSAAISFTLFCLANHSDVQKKVFEEQETLFGDKTDSFTYADLQKMKYLEQVIKESLRLYPPVPIYCRQSSSDVTYENKTLPDEDSIVIFAYGIHRDPKYFDQPEKFDPNRFANMDTKLSYAYIPFSVGPRNCIGQKFAMLQMKCLISRIIRKFELYPATPEHKLKLAAETVLTSVNGIKLGLKLRNQ